MAVEKSAVTISKMYFNKLWPVMVTKNTKSDNNNGLVPLARHVKFPCRNVQISARKKRIRKKTKYLQMTLTFWYTMARFRIVDAHLIYEGYKLFQW